MSTYEVKDPSEWREGDVATLKVDDVASVTGPLTATADSQQLRIREFGVTVRTHRGDPMLGCTTTVTRTVPDIPEPTGLGAVVRFEDGGMITRGRSDWTPDHWYMDTIGWGSWEGFVQTHGPAVALLSPGVQDGAR